MLMRKRLAMTAVAGCVALNGCESAATGGAAVHVVDSAGARLYTVDWTSALALADTFVLNDPILELGGSATDRDTDFFRIVAVVPLDERGFAVADGGHMDVRLFDWDGNLITRFGRRGEGPGEFRSIATAFPHVGDSIAAYDIIGARITIFPLTDGNPRAVTLQGVGFPPVTVLGTVADGRFVARAEIFGERQGHFRPDLVFVTYSPGGQPLDTLGSFAGDEWSVRQGRFMKQSTYPAQTFTVVTARDVTVADGATAGFERWSLDGAKLASWRSDRRRSALAPNTARSHRDSLLASSSMPAALRESMAEMMLELPFPDSLPYFSGMLADAVGHVWLRHEEPGARPAWVVIGPDGYITRIVDPEGSTIQQVSATHVFAVATDEFDVQHLRVYELPPATRAVASDGQSRQAGGR